MKEKAMELLNIFYENGYEAYVVGGFVRNMILGLPSFDVDIATNATPKEIQEIFNVVKLPFEGYGSVHLTYKKVDFEITTYRMELEYQDKRKPSKIIYTNSLKIDLKRRDFTMNTLCMDKDGNVIDFLNATNDIRNKVIKVVGDTDIKIKQDALRILRAVRFATELGFELDKDLEEAIINNRESLKELSFYRKKEELNKILASVNALKGIELLRRFSLDKCLDIDLSGIVNKTSDPIGMWAQVNPSFEYQFTNNEKAYLEAILRVLEDGNINDMELYKEGNYVCYIACQILNMDETKIYDRYDALPIKNQSEININGKDIIDILNLEDKSLVKPILSDVEEKIVLRKLENKRDVLEKYVIANYS